jgi:hypothetical protein
MNWYSYSVGVSGFNQSVGDMVEADNVMEALNLIRLELGNLVQISVRRSYYGETDCNNFTLAGHYSHEND